MATFKKIPGYSLYEISESGEIRKIVSKEVISQRVHPVYGYKMCDLLDDNLKVHTVYPHKEVARTYMPINKGSRMYVIHINGNPKDNRLKNLKWATPAEAQVHQVKMGLRKRIGNPELYKFSKFWLAKRNKKKGKDKAVTSKEKITVKGKGRKSTAKAVSTQKGKAIAKKTVATKTAAKPKAITSKKANTKKQVKTGKDKIKKEKTSSKNTSNRAKVSKKTSVKPTAKTQKPAATKKAAAKKPAAKAVKANTKKVAAKKADNKKKALPKKNVKSTKNNNKKAVSTNSKKMGENTTMKRVPSKLLKTNDEAKVERKEKRQRIKYKKVISSGKKS